MVANWKTAGVIRKTVYEARLEQENAKLRMLLRQVKKAVPADLRKAIEDYLKDDINR